MIFRRLMRGSSSSSSASSRLRFMFFCLPTEFFSYLSRAHFTNKFPMYRSVVERRASFINPNLRHWAECGFFQFNQVYKCYYCHLEKYHLSDTSHVWQQHYRWNPYCPYVLIRRGRLIFDSQVCVICMERAKDTCLWPCRHAISCQECVSTMEHCPICRQSIEKIFKIFLT